MLKQLKHLKIVFPIFNDCKSYAGLALQPPKYVLVPLCAFSEEVHANVCRWVAHNVPEWKLSKSNHLLSSLGSILAHRLAQ